MQPPQHEHKTNTRPSCVGDPSLSLLSLAFSYYFSVPAFSLSLLLFPPCKLDSGSITFLFSSFPSLAKLPCLSGPLGSVHWLLRQPEGYTSLFLCLRAISVQRWDQEMDSILLQIIQPQATNDCSCSMLYTVTDLSKTM